jgi:hypothetical protein
VRLRPCGTESAYVRHLRYGERPCAECRRAHAAGHARRSSRRASDPAAADRAGHGRASTYNNYACRCPACTEAQRRKNARRRMP